MRKKNCYVSLNYIKKREIKERKLLLYIIVNGKKMKLS